MSRQIKDGVKERVVKKTLTTESRLWKVLLFNDDITPMDFVIDVLMQVFDKKRTEAARLMLKIHNGESGVVGIYQRSIAASKKMQADAMSKSEKHLLKVKLEIEKTATKQPKSSDLYSDYLKAGKNLPIQKKILSCIIEFVLQDPESKFAEVLIKIAKRGDARCTLAIEPLIEIFWEGDFEWQEEVVRLLGEITHLAPLALRIRVGIFLGHVAVSSVFVGGSGLDHPATVALTRISHTLFEIHMKKLPTIKRIKIWKEGDARRLFDEETKNALK
jgi:ATP-dependent Clp protease adaptor protein ClpS